jgi:HD-GYP domain-containing protein (c-di-GMP phosphodiesterase class II)
MSSHEETGDVALYNSRVINPYIKLIKNKYSYVNISELLSYADMKSYEVADQGHWFTQEQVNRFQEKLQELTGNDDIAREAGRYAASPEAMGVMWQYVLGMVGPATVFALAGKVAGNFTRSSDYSSKRISSNKVELIVRIRDNCREQPFQCQSRMGWFEAMAAAVNHKVLNIEHPECLFQGGEICRYLISWERNLSDHLKTSRILAGIAAILAVAGYAVFDPKLAFSSVLPLVTIMLLVLSILVEKVEKRELLSILDNLRVSTDKLLEQIDINYNNALMTNEVGQAITKQSSMQIDEYADSHANIENILQNVVQIFEKRLDYKRGLILLSNSAKTRLEIKAGFGYEDEHRELLKKSAFNLNRPQSRGAFVVSFREQKPILINELADIEDSLSLRSKAFARKMGAQSFICCPIICDGESIGVLAVDNPRSNRPLVNSDMSLLMGIAPVIGIAIRHAEHIEVRNRQFKSLLQLLAATIDARDPLTAGHSEKVTEYALGICREMELSTDQREMIRVAALLHDYGKIAVPDAILKKTGRLTIEEYEIVKTHSEKSREILEQINFEGIFKQVPEVAGAHHEKMDGSGYPRGIKGKEIPLGARIIAVADFFEAITSKRHYREPMPLEVAFRLLHEESGVHFDKKVVEAFSRYFIKVQPEGLPPALSRREADMFCLTTVSLNIDDEIRSGGGADSIANTTCNLSGEEFGERPQPELSCCLPDDDCGSNRIKAKDRVVCLDSHKARR